MTQIQSSLLLGLALLSGPMLATAAESSASAPVAAAVTEPPPGDIGAPFDALPAPAAGPELSPAQIHRQRRRELMQQVRELAIPSPTLGL